MFLRGHAPVGNGMSLLHACGDVSSIRPAGGVFKLFAPRMWRCFSGFPECWQRYAVCSTHVEMFPIATVDYIIPSRLLHACGDVSVKLSAPAHETVFAPRMWRCFWSMSSSAVS